MEIIHWNAMTQNRGHQKRGSGDVCGFIPMRTDIGGMPGEGVTRKGAQPGQDP